jgi:DNA-binding transcriptional LysR family regulator
VQITGNGNNGRLPLEEIEAFVLVAIAGSYTAAASRANLSHSSLSRKVAHLESILGCRLFDRKPHGVVTTIEGIDHLQRFRYALDQLGAAMGERQAGENAAVRISLLHSVAVPWLFPRHTKLEQMTGGVPVRYQLERRTADFREGIDLAIRFGLGSWPGVRAQRLWQGTLRPVANRCIAAALGDNPTSERLLDFPLLNLGAPISWKEWFAPDRIDYELRPQDHVFAEHITIMSAAEHGIGIALGRFETDHLMDKAGLVYLSPRVCYPDRGFFLIRDVQRPLRPAAMRYAEAMLQLAERSEAEIAAFLA